MRLVFGSQKLVRRGWVLWAWWRGGLNACRGAGSLVKGIGNVLCNENRDGATYVVRERCNVAAGVRYRFS